MPLSARSMCPSAPQLRPVRDAEALRPPPPPERGAARRLDRPGPVRRSPRSASPEETAHDRRRHHPAPHPRKLRRRPMGPRHRPGPDAPRRRHRRPGRRGSTPPASTSPPRSPTAATTVGPKLRKLSFHERAVMLKALGQFLMAQQGGVLRREPRHRRHPRRRLDRHRGRRRHAALLRLQGPPRAAERPRPHRRRRRGALQGRDLLRPAHPDRRCEGVAIHINAFNFPVWGMLEKVAPTFIAGLPSHREAGQPDRLPDRARRPPHRRVAASSPRAPSSSSPAPPATSSTTSPARTSSPSPAPPGPAASSRSRPAIVENSTRFTMEADSLNAAILGPDAAPGTPEFDLFVKEVAREMTVKAGQKCTAIRRVIAPARLHRRARRRPRRPPRENRPRRPVERGDPHGRRSPASTSAARSASASASCSRRPRSSPATPTTCASPPATPRRAPSSTRSSSSPTTRSPRPPSTTSRPSARSPPSCPTTTSTRPSRSPGAARARLVASVFTDDKAVAEEAVLGLAPFHGRVLIGNRLSAKTSTGHGSPLPVLVHGGPGRAGGGEEMGGIRGVKHYMQRTAVQGAPRLLSAVTGRWIEGADAPSDGTHPFRKSLAELQDRRPARHRHPRRSRSRTSSISPASPATPSTPTWTRPPRRRTPSSTAASPTAT